MTTTKTAKVTMLRQRIWQGSQDWNREDIIEVTGHRLRMRVKRDSYVQQSYGKTERWDGSQWQTVVTLNGHVLQNEITSGQRNVPLSAFDVDMDGMLKEAFMILGPGPERPSRREYRAPISVDKYSVAPCHDEDGMDILKAYFPEGNADNMNFVLFSTSGIHGSYSTIEDHEDGDEECGPLTFLIIQPRKVSLVYGNVEPQDEEDFNFLKGLRTSSHEAISDLGMAS